MPFRAIALLLLLNETENGVDRVCCLIKILSWFRFRGHREG